MRSERSFITAVAAAFIRFRAGRSFGFAKEWWSENLVVEGRG